MFDFIRKLRESEAEKRQQAITAYLDGELTAGERQRFEQQMAADPSLRSDMEQQQLIKLNVSRIPRMKAPRNFTLDPALYGRSAPQPNARLYPGLRLATVLLGVFFVIAVSAEVLTFSGVLPRNFNQAPLAGEIAMETAADLVPEGEALGFALAQDPQMGSESDGVALESEAAAEKMSEVEQPMAAPAEAIGEAQDADLAEAEEAPEESLAAIVVTAIVEAVEEGQPIEEAVAEAPASEPLPTEVQSEDREFYYSEAGTRAGGPGTDSPASGGAEPAEAPLLEAAATEIANRSATAPTEIATRLASMTPAAAAELEQEPDLAVGDLVVQDSVVESEGIDDALVDTTADSDAEAEATDGESAIEELPFASADEDQDGVRLDDRIGPPLLQVLILLLGIGVIVLAGLTLFVRWQMKN